jgi:putative transposase
MGAEHHRRSLRLRGYDYASLGAYFVTMCTRGHACVFGTVDGGRMHLNDVGRAAAAEWERSTGLRREVQLDAYVVMPNHLHGIVVIECTQTTVVGATGRSPLQLFRPTGPSPRSLGSFVAGFKAAATTGINRLRNTPGAAVWQRNYHERIIRNEAEWHRLRQYVAENPSRWDNDAENPQRTRWSGGG